MQWPTSLVDRSYTTRRDVPCWIVRNNRTPAYVHHDPIAILRSLFGLKDVDVCAVSRTEDLVEIAIEHHVGDERCQQRLKTDPFSTVES